MTEDHLEQTGTDAPVDLLRHIHVEDRSDASSVILHVPHASRLIPDELRASFVVAEPAIVAELDALTDTATDRIAGAAATASIVRSGLSRLVVDVERFPDDTEEMNGVGMGVLYTHGSRRQESVYQRKDGRWTGATYVLRPENDPDYLDLLTTEKLLAFLDGNPHVDIEIEGEGDEPQLVFNPRPAHRFAILKLIADDFLESLLSGRHYEAGSKQQQ